MCWLVLTTLTGFSIYRISYILYGDPTFTGRSIIWDFVKFEIEHRPLLGWGSDRSGWSARRAQHRQRAGLGKGHAQRP